MKVAAAAVAVIATLSTSTLAQDECVSGSFILEFDGTCTADAVVATYEDQVFNSAGAKDSSCVLDAAADLTAKVVRAGLADLEALCDLVYASQDKVPFTDAAKRGTDLLFEKMFFNGRTDWQEEVETIHETDDLTRTSILKEDAEQVRVFYDGIAQGRRVEWPGSLSNFQSSVTDTDGKATCTTNAAMCCWPKDRQANDNNGNCAKEYDQNCVDKDPADNTNLCFVDLERGNKSTGFDSTDIIVYPGDNSQGEGSIHCHGLAWSNDVNDHTARYKANNLFYVSMYDHMYKRGYVENIPGAPMCGCVEQMPTVSRSDCTQVDLTESIEITYHADTNTFHSKLASVYVDFNACKGIDNRNNDLWAYMARLWAEGAITSRQFGEAGRIITNTGCYEATRYHLNAIGMTRGYDHDVSQYTKVAGRDDLKDGHPHGREAFKSAFWEHSMTKPNNINVAEFPVGETPIIMRICASCADTHKRIWYRRKTPVSDPNFDLLNNILHQRNGGNGENRWGEDFSLHSSYDDAVTGDNPWQCPGDSFNYGAPFYGECSPDGRRVRDQYSIFHWYPGPRPDVAYYVNKPEHEGVKELELSTSQRFSNLHTDVDIGDVGIPGKTFESDEGTLYITGAGWDIWGQNDMGHYLSEPVVGDIDVKVHIAAFSGIVNGWAKAGIMLRSDNSDDATHVFALLAGTEGLCLQSRPSKKHHSYGQSCYETNPHLTSAWIRLIKKMDTVEMYRSFDGSDWIHQSTLQIRFPDDAFRVGLAVTSHHDGYVSEATFKNYTIEEYNFPTSSPSFSTAPTPWEPAVSIGGARAGSYTYYPDTGISKYVGYGTGIWGKSDSFFFHNVQHAFDGAFDVIAYTHSFHTGWKEAKGGIMIRDSNDPDSSHAFIGVFGYYNGVTFQSRASAGAVTIHHQTNWVSQHKAWIKLSKPATGSVITAYYKINALDEWIEIGSVLLTLTGHSVQIGTAVTSGDPSGNSGVSLQTKDFRIDDNPIASSTSAGRKLLGA